MQENQQRILENFLKIKEAAAQYLGDDRCMVAPAPELRERMKDELESLRGSVPDIIARKLKVREPTAPGLNDGLIYPGNTFELGTPLSVVRSAAANRAPLSGTVRVVVVLVEFSDKGMTATREHFEELFFSTGVLPKGSVREYFREVSNNRIDIQGEVVGPCMLPRTLAEYAHGESGTGNALPNARTMARDAVEVSNPTVNFAQYDNDGDGFVDAFIVIHAGSGAEQTGSPGDIWSHKWVLSGGAYNADGTQIYAYLTVPEDSRIGVCCHELGHLLFGWPDLYDTDYTSEGVGNWCLMGGGSWLGAGDVPAHPSAWCKSNQGWVTVNQVTANSTMNISDVKKSFTVYRLWKDGASGQEYFLLENRQKTGFDAQLPGQGFLIWHIDEAIQTNSNEAHPKVRLVQADGKRDLENGSNRGDTGDVYPGVTKNRTFDATSNPNSKSYGGVDTNVAVVNIGSPGTVMSAEIRVRAVAPKGIKEGKDTKEQLSEGKTFFKEIKDLFEGKIYRVDKRYEKPTEKPAEMPGAGQSFTPPGGMGFGQPRMGAGYEMWSQPGPMGPQDLEARVAYLEYLLAQIEPFIGAAMRPDLTQSALSNEPGGEQKNLADTKRQTDTKYSDGPVP